MIYSLLFRLFILECSFLRIVFGNILWCLLSIIFIGVVNRCLIILVYCTSIWMHWIVQIQLFLLISIFITLFMVVFAGNFLFIKPFSAIILQLHGRHCPCWSIYFLCCSILNSFLFLAHHFIHKKLLTSSYLL